MACDLFTCLPLFSITTDFVTTYYNVIGIPVWKIHTIADNRSLVYRTQYCLLGIPIIEIANEYKDADEYKYVPEE